ncbi:hypothetical protein ZIOFF_028191 [Zingiber officinale]|uniref:Legumain prodomain domain-containing protein n=1 Tax=Zingiber officinale TaxID=94328 RepID=A0A8J5GKY8_ZINOF|nr:hypothetical protein ZIOFF_028191 [Zingiber officinale]
MSSSLLLLLSLFFPSSLSAAVTAQSSASPSNSSTVYDILQEYNLPPGILPDTVKSFSVTSNDYFVIDLSGECYVDFEYVVYYAPRMSGFLGYDSISNLEGVQIHSYLIWYGVSYIKRAKKVVRLAFEIIYVEACESGSIFEDLMLEDLNAYVTTTSNAVESGWGTYCPGMDPPPPPEYMTCPGDLYSVAWMEDSENHNLKEETVKMRTLNQNTYSAGSHVMEYGDKNVKPEKLYLYQGFNPANANLTENALRLSKQMGVINQRDADLLFLWHMFPSFNTADSYERLEEGSNKKKEILSEITEMMMHRAHLDSSIELIDNLIFGSDVAPSVLKTVRPSGQALVDDWVCLKIVVQTFELHCGSLTQYGMKYMRAFANICNEGVSKDEMEEACGNVCGSYNSAKWSPFIHGYSA